MVSYVLLRENAETAKKKYEKKYKCPYCDGRYTRPKLPTHIDRTHADLIPEGYSALRVAFNAINHKEHGTCIICKRESPWNESKGRYDRLCGREECKQAYARMAHKRVKDVYGTDSILNDPRYKEEMEKKMLAARKISGEYKFSDGGKIGYTGSYEKKLLEFMDKIMHIESSDILGPGPIIYYEFEGKTLMYISDFLYEPYNLIIEVKDGGSNPNNRPMEEYRAKQLAKEDAVRKDGKYNYLRLTNNDFGQLMEVMAVLKYTLDEDPDQRVIKVNESTVDESMTGVIGAAIAPWPVPHEANKDNFYMVQHLKNNTFAYGITKDPTQNEIISIDAEKGYIAQKMNKKDIPGSYITFKMLDQDKAEETYREALSLLKSKRPVDDTDYFYRTYTESNLLTDDQILFDRRFAPVQNFDERSLEECTLLERYLTDPNYYASVEMMKKTESLMEEIRRDTYDRA